MRKKVIVPLVVLAFVMAWGVVAFAATSTVTIGVAGMQCENCVASVTKKLKATEGVEEVRVDLEKKEAWIKFDDQKTSVAKLREVINSTGFKAGETKSATE